jgi:hypothetical protein
MAAPIRDMIIRAALAGLAFAIAALGYFLL